MNMREILLASLLVTACGHKKSDPPPPKPSNGAPIAFVGSDVKPGGDHKGSVEVKEYNFSDKRAARYSILLRYHDASGAKLKVKPGTPFEADFDFWSYSGKEFVCEPSSWCSYTLKDLNVPEKAASVEIVARSVDSLKDDIHFDETPLFDSKGSLAWPD